MKLSAMIIYHRNWERHWETFTLTTLPKGKHAVGGRWVNTVKGSPDGYETFKARYVAKAYSQVEGSANTETFSPTAIMTSVWAWMQFAVKEDTHIPNGGQDCLSACSHGLWGIYGATREFGGKIKYRETLDVQIKKKSLYGLKQSGCNLNLLPHNHLTKNGLIQKTKIIVSTAGKLKMQK